MHPSLEVFDPRIAQWFAKTYGAPTDIQARAWPEIARGRHVLALAPTGSGKTLTAFLWALNQLLTGAFKGSGTQVLYVSPLKALNNDIQRNLLRPLRELKGQFGGAAPEIRVVVRSGDTLQSERRRMLRNPPQILITTPESLNILLATSAGQSIFANLKTVILDEIHAVLGSKRGTHLITGIERLELLSPGFSRLALSATVRPAQAAAHFVAGWQTHGTGDAVTYSRRPISLIESEASKRHELRIEVPDRAALWPELTAALKERIRKNRTTLIFVNSRRLAEKITRLINEEEDEPLAYAHHGSLSREVRAAVENRLRQGALKAVVSTNSLELGIDIGALDEVLMVQTPPAVSSTLQRLGRAGHQVGQISRGCIFPLFGRDLLEAAVMVQAAREQAVEETLPPISPLDVLAQVMLAMVATRDWDVDELYHVLRRAEPYHELTRAHFDATLAMLAGRYAQTRVPTLHPRVSLDTTANTVRSRSGTSRLVLLGGGTIPNRGTYTLRASQGGAKLGELDEEFVWERAIGDTFSLGAHSWRIDQVTKSDVFVRPADRAAAMAPFWRAEAQQRGWAFSDRLGRSLAQAEKLLAQDEEEKLIHELVAEGHMAVASATELVGFLRSQRAATRCALPHRHHWVIESVAPEAGSDPGEIQVVLHTLCGGKVNYPLALALQVVLRRNAAAQVEIAHDNDCILLSGHAAQHVSEALATILSDNVEALAKEGLTQSGLWGAYFRENAGRALLLPLAHPRRRVPLWLSRERAKELLSAVASYEDFPITIETWKNCLFEAFDLPTLKTLVDELASGDIALSVVATSAPSPFAAQITWKMVNRLMYEDDTPVASAAGRLRESLTAEVAHTAALRPMLAPAIVAALAAKLHRTAPGYAPASPAELCDLVEDRVLVSAAEWEDLLAACERDHGIDRQAWLDAVREKVVLIEVPGAAHKALCTPNRLGQVQAACHPARPPVRKDLDTLVAEWLSFYGPVGLEMVSATFGLSDQETNEVLDLLSLRSCAVIDRLTADAHAPQVCDRRNLERLLRMARHARRPTIAASALRRLPLFLAQVQGLGQAGCGCEALMAAIEPLLFYPAGVELWETELLPARLAGYDPKWLDELFRQTDLRWAGCGKERITLLFDDDTDLLPRAEVGRPLTPLFPAGRGRFSLSDLLAYSGESSADLAQKLWELAWAGEISTDSFEALRRGVASGFAASSAAEGLIPRRRGGGHGARFARWQMSRPWSGTWFRLRSTDQKEPVDALKSFEGERERCRVLLDRYGVLFREALGHELSSFGWAQVLRALRVMELGGETISGQFFSGLSGLQFAGSRSLRALREPDEERVYWLNAGDPASVCGLAVAGLDPRLPRRVAGSHVVFRGSDLVVVSNQRGRELTVLCPPDDPWLRRYFGFIEAMLTRRVRPRRSVEIEMINGTTATRSPYRRALADLFELSAGPQTLELRACLARAAALQ
jgi:ATP-dependent Lhr-like helicase